MKIVFLHGWSVTNTDTYGEFPRILALEGAERGMPINIVNIFLGRYISFHNEVRMPDVVRALNAALLEVLGDENGQIEPFSCITHSTGGPVARSWIMRYYGAERLDECPLQNLVMLAPANHGSPLAALGTSRVGRLKSWFQDVEPGAGILEWLEMGSDESTALNRDWLKLPSGTKGGTLRSFVLTGDTIDKKLYDYLNAYTGEIGSDGVVRVAGANLNYHWLQLVESEEKTIMEDSATYQEQPRTARLLKLSAKTIKSPYTPILVVPHAAHSGKKLGIMNSPTTRNSHGKPVVESVLDALSVSSKTAFKKVGDQWQQQNLQRAESERGYHRCFQLIVRVQDDQGMPINDYDFILTAGKRYDPNKLPRRFFVDKQRNKHSPHVITFFLDFDVMMKVRDGKFGFRIQPRPDAGFAKYDPVEFHSDALSIDQFVDPHSTVYLDITLKRRVDAETARFEPGSSDPLDFKDIVTGGIEIE